MNATTHDCGGTILCSSGEHAHRYCDRCGAFTHDLDAPLPSGTNKTANQAAFDAGKMTSPALVVPQLYWDGVLAARYHGASVSDRTLLAHAVAAVDFKTRRLSMKCGDVLCRTVEPSAMACRHEDVGGEAKCSKCLDRIAWYGLTIR